MATSELEQRQNNQGLASVPRPGQTQDAASYRRRDRRALDNARNLHVVQHTSYRWIWLIEGGAALQYHRWVGATAALLTSVYPTFGRAAVPPDPTEDGLKRCLESPANASTAGQVGCELVAYKAYDRRMNAAYSALLSVLPRAAAENLREAQLAWLRFRDAEVQALTAFFSTRQGTMYAPMQAAAQTSIVKKRATALEAQLRILRIDD